MIDNFEKIKKIMSFDDENDFYFFQAIKRRKDNPGMDKGEIAIKDWYVGSFEYFDKKIENMIEIATSHNARITMRVNKRNYKKASTKMLIELAKMIDSEQYRSSKKVFSSVCGKYSSDPVKKWIIDVDSEDMNNINEIKNVIQRSLPEGNKILMDIPSKTGVHIITKAFDLREFNKLFEKVEIKKDNPTNIYIP